MKRATRLKELTDVLVAITEKKTTYKIELFWDGRQYHWHIKLPGISAEDFRKVTGPGNDETTLGVTK